MTPVLVDSNVILDVATEDPRWGVRSTEALARVADAAPLVPGSTLRRDTALLSEEEREEVEMAGTMARGAGPTGHAHHAGGGGTAAGRPPNDAGGCQPGAGGARGVAAAARRGTRFEALEPIGRQGGRGPSGALAGGVAAGLRRRHDDQGSQCVADAFRAELAFPGAVRLAQRTRAVPNCNRPLDRPRRLVRARRGAPHHGRQQQR